MKVSDLFDDLTGIDKRNAIKEFRELSAKSPILEEVVLAAEQLRMDFSEPPKVDVKIGFLLCPRCQELKTKEEMSKDHIIPRWFINNVFNFGIPHAIVKEWEKGNKEKVCKKCNALKAGKIDYDHPKSRIFVLQFIEELTKKLKQHEPKN